MDAGKSEQQRIKQYFSYSFLWDADLKFDSFFGEVAELNNFI